VADRAPLEADTESHGGSKEPESPERRLARLERRRAELWAALLVVVVSIVVVVVVFAARDDFLPALTEREGILRWILMVLLAGLGLALILYVVEKERDLRKLTRQLLDEKVISTALSQRLSEISRLSEVGKAVNTTLDVDDVFELILTSALEILGGTEGSIMLLDEDEITLRVVSYRGPTPDKVTGTTRVGNGISGLVAARREPMLIQGTRLTGELRDMGHPERAIHSSMCVPLVRRKEILGVLNLNETEGERTFTEGDLTALGFFAEHAAIAIGNARAFEKERETVSRLEELDRMKSDFVATVSHELKTPITAIIGAAKTVSRRGIDMSFDDNQSFIEMIDRQGNRLLRLVEDVLTAAQLESGGQRSFRRELLDLGAAAGDVVGELRQTELGRERDIQLRMEPARPFVWGDLTAIQQIITNLLENALKYSESDTPVTLAVQETPDEAVIKVTDHGRGIPHEQLEAIFDRFRQAEAASTRSVGGFGLGLYIVNKLVGVHGGSVEVESEVGMGTTFRVHLPKRAADRGKMLASEEHPAG
jgi:signal transduction histidine kinase